MKRTLSLALLALVACSRATVPQPPVEAPPSPTADAGTATLPPEAPSPLRVVERQSADAPLVSIRIVFEAGSADDPPGQEGLTRLTARLMAEGGTESLTYAEFTRALFPMAARVDYAVDRDLTVFTGTVHRDHIARFYPLLRDVVLHPRLAEEDFTRVRTQSRADLTLNLRGSNDEELGKEALQSLLYASHPYGHPAVGTEQGLDAARLALVRAHRARIFSRARVLIGLAGAYPNELVSTVRTDFDTLPVAPAARAALPAVTAPTGLHVVIIDKPAASATAFSMGRPLTITRRDPEQAALQFATNHLGLHRQSVGVLYQTIRESRGLNYGDYAYAEHYEQDGWSRFPRPNLLRRQQYASVWLRPVPNRYAHFALRAALRAVARERSEAMPVEDFERVRTFLNGYVGLYTQTESARLGFAMDDLLDGATGTWAERRRTAWAAMDAAAVQRAASAHLSSTDLWVAIVSPQAQALADALEADAPSPITYDTPKPAEVMAEDREIAAFPLHIARENVSVIPLARVFANADWTRATP